jgi:hypothetical protein
MVAISRLKQHLLSSASHMASARAWAAQAQAKHNQSARLDAAASATPSAGGHGKPSSRPLLRANRGGAR